MKKKTLVWQDLLSWRNPFLSVMVDYVSEDVLHQLRVNPPKYFVSDDLTWLEDAICTVQGRRVDILSVAVSRITTLFSHARSFHACCPTSTNSYYDQGLRPLNPEELRKDAHAIFTPDKFPSISEEALDRAISEVNYPLRAGRVFFALDERSLVERCGHYLIYGSEALVGIAASLSDFREFKDYRSALRLNGHPTVFICDVPIVLWNDATLNELCGCLLEASIESLFDDDYFHPQHQFSYDIRTTLPPDCIVDHYHPKKLVDPLMRNIPVEI